MELFDIRNNSGVSLEDCAELLISVIPEMMCIVRKDMRAGRPSELSVPQFRALIYLQHHPGSSLSGIADHLGLARSTTSQLVDGLMQRNYVVRESAQEDRRRAMFLLTERGRAMLDAVRAKAQARMSERLSPLSPEERRSVGEAMLLLTRISRKTSEQGF
jgi:DNA-binding MarR family transcriptional regulator